MKLPVRHQLLVALAVGGIGGLAGMITIAPVGCASDCGNNCPINTAIIAASHNVDLPFVDVAWVGPACPDGLPRCRGDGRSTFCTIIDVLGDAEGSCDVLIRLADREPMAIHLEFGPPVTQGCCRGYPVIGDWHFTIPVSSDGGIYGGDGNTDAVSVIEDDAATTDTATADASDGGADSLAPDAQ
jgi:hypothetical protein